MYPLFSGLPSTRAVIQQKSEFAKKASEIGLGIHKTSAKLQKLAQLAKRTSMFDDPTQEINEITGIVKQDIQMLHNSIADLQKLSLTNVRQNGGVQEQRHSSTVVDNLRTRLKDTTKEFQEVLTVRSETLKDQNQRRQIFSSLPENGIQISLKLPNIHLKVLKKVNHCWIPNRRKSCLVER